MKRRYWLDLFTGNTWEEFIKSEATVTGFRKRKHKLAKHIKPGDYFLCYITGISRFAGVLEAKSECYIDESNNIWKNEDFPVRFDVEFIYKLTPETGIYIQDLNDKLSIFKDRSSPRAWTAQFRGSPAEFNQEDGEIIVEEIKKAVINPVKREYNKKKYLRTPKTYDTKIGVVTVPEEDEPEPQVPPEENKLTHEDIQGILLKLGSDLGLDIWVARNDRNKTYCGRPFSDIPGFREQLPVQFDEVTNKIIELIDVLWLQGDAIVAAFEVEHTSAIYSGLLRMADLISMQPNIRIDLYIVAPDNRRDKVFKEINRPTFAKLKPPLPEICKYISYTELVNKIEEVTSVIKYLKPEFIEEIAESCEPE